MKPLFPSLFLLLIHSFCFGQNISEAIDKHGASFPPYTEVAIAIVDGDQVHYHGFIKTGEGFEAKDNANAVFEIGSISKVFTSTLLATKVQEGKLKLEDPVHKLLKYRLKGNPKITLSHLANHTSGLPRLPENIMRDITNNPTNPYKNYDEEDLKEYCTKLLVLENEVGSKSSYSNLGAGMLGHALSIRYKKTYEELLQELIFEPLKMTQSTTNRTLVKDKLIPGHSPVGTPTTSWDMNVLTPAGGILSSVSDLSKFIQANFDDSNPIYALQRKKTITINEKVSVALGWHIITTESGNELYWHNGATGGYTSSMALDVPTKKGVIVLSNLSPMHPSRANIEIMNIELLNQMIETSSTK